MENETEEPVWECCVCSGPVVIMGVLGRREHGRCRNCGLDQHREAKEEPVDQHDGGCYAEGATDCAWEKPQKSR